MSETTEERETQAGRTEADGYPHWRVTLYTMWVAQLCAMIGFAFVMPFIPFYVRDLGVSEGRVALWSGLLSSGSGLTMCLMAPVWGYLADRYGRKLMVQRAMFGGALILAAMAYVRNAGQLLALRVLQGGVTGTVPASVAMVSSVVPRAALGFSLGLMQTAVFTGNSIGPFLGGLFAEKYGYRIPFLVTGGLLLTGGLLVLFGAKERFQRPTQEERENGGSLRDVLAAPGLLPLLSVYTMMNLSWSFVGPIFPLFVEQVAGTPEKAAAETGMLLMVSGLTGAVAAVTAGRLSDRYGHKRVLICCTVFAGLVCFPHVVAHNLAQLFWLRALAGIGAGGIAPAMNAMIASAVSRQHLGKAYGLTTTASAFGWGVGPFLGGVAATQFGLRVPFAIMGGLLFAMAVVAQRGVGNQETRGEAETEDETAQTTGN